MSNADVPQPAGQIPPAADTTPAFDEIRVYSHSPLFYWWPVWLFGFLFALLTLIDNQRMVLVPGDSLAVKEKVGEQYIINVYGVPEESDRLAKLGTDASAEDKQKLLVA